MNQFKIDPPIHFIHSVPVHHLLCVCNGDCFGAVVFTSVTMIAYQDHLNAGFSKVCEVYAIEFCCIVEVNICCSKLAWRCSLMDDLLVLHQPVIVGTSTLQSEKSFRSLKLFSFPASFAYLNPFQQWLYDFYIHFFSYWRQLRDSYATITETCHSTHIISLLLVLIASIVLICKLLWIKVSLNVKKL